MKKSRFNLLVGLFILLIFLAIFYARKRQEKVLGLVSPVVDITPTLSVSAQVIATVSAVATPSSTIEHIIKDKPGPTPKPTPEKAETVYELIERFATQYGVDPNVLRHITLCESGFKSNAVNREYVGLFQFGVITWENIREEMGEDSNPSLRFSAEEAVQTAAYAVSKGKGKIWPNCFPK